MLVYAESAALSSAPPDEDSGWVTDIDQGSTDPDEVVSGRKAELSV